VTEITVSLEPKNSVD